MIEHLEWRFSGGAANANPDLSFGGVMSSEVIPQESFNQPVNITGVEILWVSGNNEAASVLHYDAATQSLTWAEFGTPGPAVDVSVDGRYTVFSDTSYYMVVEVVAASLPVADEDDTIDIAVVPSALFDDITLAERTAGTEKYRCVYLYNSHPTVTFIDVRPYLGWGQPTPAILGYSLDTAGVGNGVTTGVASTPADDETEPASAVEFLLFEDPALQPSVGALAPGQARALWIRRGIGDPTGPAISDLTFQVSARIVW